MDVFMSHARPLVAFNSVFHQQNPSFFLFYFWFIQPQTKKMPPEAHHSKLHHFLIIFPIQRLSWVTIELPIAHRLIHDHKPMFQARPGRQEDEHGERSSGRLIMAGQLGVERRISRGTSNASGVLTTTEVETSSSRAAPVTRYFKCRPPLAAYRPSDTTCAAEIGTSSWVPGFRTIESLRVKFSHTYGDLQNRE